MTVNSATSITATSPAGTGTVDVTVTTAGRHLGHRAGDQFTYVTTPHFTADTPPLTAVSGTTYSYNFAATGAPTPTYALGVGAPAWLSINASTGKVSGTVPSGISSFTYSVSATNSVGSVGVGPFTVSVSARGAGYWTVTSDGAIFANGSVGLFGSLGSIVLNRPIVGAAATQDGKGYWMVASDGGVFAFGDAPSTDPPAACTSTHPSSAWQPRRTARATGWSPPTAASSPSVTPRFAGSTGGMHLNAPIVGMAATPDGKGYWLVASDGGVFAFGDAAFAGSTGGMPSTPPIVGMAADRRRQGLLVGGLRRRRLRLR